MQGSGGLIHDTSDGVPTPDDRPQRVRQRIPRDAHDQCAALDHIPAGEALPGDLYFFARPGKAVHHVGFVSEAGMLHAFETGGFLEDRPLTPDRLDTLVTAARL